jgi:hypothetical protein
LQAAFSFVVKAVTKEKPMGLLQRIFLENMAQSHQISRKKNVKSPD